MALKKVDVLNKMTYTVRIVIEVTEEGRYTYRKLAGKTSTGQIKVSQTVYQLLLSDPSIIVSLW